MNESTKTTPETAAAPPLPAAAANPLKPSQRMKIPRQQSIEQAPEARVKNFTEVSLGR